MVYAAIISPSIVSRLVNTTPIIHLGFSLSYWYPIWWSWVSGDKGRAMGEDLITHVTQLDIMQCWVVKDGLPALRWCLKSDSGVFDQYMYFYGIWVAWVSSGRCLYPISKVLSELGQFSRTHHQKLSMIQVMLILCSTRFKFHWSVSTQNVPIKMLQAQVSCVTVGFITKNMQLHHHFVAILSEVDPLVACFWSDKFGGSVWVYATIIITGHTAVPCQCSHH